MSTDIVSKSTPKKEHSGQSRLSAFGSAFVAGGYTMYPVLLILVIVGAIVAPRFATAANLLNILDQVSVLGLTTIGLTFVVLIGRLDLSLEGIVGFAPMLAAVTLVPAAAGGLGLELPSWTGLFVALGTAGLIGFFNGFMVVRVGLNPFISTLGLLVLLRGGVLIISNGRSIYSPGKALTYLGSESWLGVPVSVIVFIVVAAVVGLVFHYHRYGRALYAIGGNEDAARAAGINVDRVIWSAFVFAALLAGLAGVLMTGRLDSTVTTQGQGIIFSAFAAAVIGGVSLGGGRGTIVGVVSGVLLIGVINNLLTLAQVPSFYVQASTGAVIIVAAVLTTIASQRSSGVRTRT
ncbi:ABC transporter permease [Mesorhizobium sp. B2-3-14]|uniref:ABC transporter permease n=1 Tax=unclassified Mesorhizobium TaxID=325217 RepID=UPI001125B912|nr:MULTISPECIES: ABC transporter permease [unclassified Mesorhizobium]TPK73897.1 ABC transporter permease [Mesorhizobium sp. B2-4-18]TPL74085.1 ABC transporter permease [Mesorhizobium sp. B2-3-15]TPL79283.1 ABC transporter permease [Mesorhizobium sp. B2-3-14]